MTSSVPISSLPAGTRIRWTDGSKRAHEGVIVEWLDRPKLSDAIRVLETITSIIPHAIGSRFHVEVLEHEQREEDLTDSAK